MRILIWHVHAAWLTSFVQGPHEYYVPVVPGRGSDGRGRARTYDWPDRVREVPANDLASTDFDVVVLQRPVELALFARWTGRGLGRRGVPAVYLEHNTPRGDVTGWLHPIAARADVPLVHVSDFNRMAWDNGRAPASVIEHGIPDLGYRYGGALDSLAVVVNEPVRRWRVAGLDLVAGIAHEVPVTVYGLGSAKLQDCLTTGLAGVDDLPQDALHDRMAEHFAYLHPNRWTSAGLSLVEAMTLGLPVLANGATSAYDVVPSAAGVVSADPDRLARTATRWLADPAEARETGRAARNHALRRFGLDRFLDDWERLLKEVSR